MTLTAPRVGSSPAAVLSPAVATRRRPTLPGILLRAAVLLGVAYLVLVKAPNDEVLAPFAVDAAIFSIVALSLNIVVGYTGQLSLGHQGFVGVGAFAAAYSLTERGVPFALTFVIAALIAALFALLIGVAALRITGLYLSLITLVFGLTLENSLFEVPEFTNAGAGQPADRPEFLFEDRAFFYFCVAFVVAVLYLDWRLMRSKAGRALLALKENERVAEAFGINVTAYKLLAFTLSGAFAGLAGALFAYSRGNVTGNDFGFFLALTFVLMTVVGGLGSRLGVVIGASFFGIIDWILEDTFVHVGVDKVFGLFGSAGAQAEQFAPQFIGAGLLLLTLLQFPGGIAEQIRPITRWLAGERFSLHHAGDSGVGAVEGSSVRA